MSGCDCMEFLKTIKSKNNFEETVLQVLRNAEKNGWAIFGIHDIAERLRSKGFNHKNIKVIEICKGAYADKVLNSNKEVSVCLPCRISVFEDNGVKVSAARPTALSGIFGIEKEMLEEIENDMLKIMELD